MNIDRAVFVFAGLMVLLGILLSLALSPWWLALSAFAGLNMIQAAFTGFCPAAMVFKMLGLKPGNAFL
jgi:Inner membrane protein YgaP-like, transmembrane domain